MSSAHVTLCLQDLFKAFARHLSHSLTQKPSPGSSGEYLRHRVRRHLGGSAGRRPALTIPHPPSPICSEGRGPEPHPAVFPRPGSLRE